MPVSFEANLAGDRELAAALRRMSSPEVISAALRRGARELTIEMRAHVSGPRPRRLDVVTGELLRSFATDDSGLPDRIRVGTPLFWAEFHEVGSPRNPARPFAQPALERTLRRLPEFFVQEQERARDADRGGKLPPRLVLTAGARVVAQVGG